MGLFGPPPFDRWAADAERERRAYELLTPQERGRYDRKMRRSRVVDDLFQYGVFVGLPIVVIAWCIWRHYQIFGHIYP